MRSDHTLTPSNPMAVRDKATAHLISLLACEVIVP